MLLIILAANEYIKLEDFYSSFQYTEEMIRSDAEQLVYDVWWMFISLE